MAGKRPAALPGLRTELLELVSGGSGIAGRLPGLPGVLPAGSVPAGVVPGAVAAAVDEVRCTVSETVRGWGRFTVAGCTTALRVTWLTPACTVSCACSFVGVEPGDTSVHDAVLFPVGQPLVNEGVGPESRIWTFPDVQFSAQTCTVNCAGLPGWTVPDGCVTLRHRLGGEIAVADPVGLGLELTSVAMSVAGVVPDPVGDGDGEGGGDASAEDEEGDGVLVADWLADGDGLGLADGLADAEGDGLGVADGDGLAVAVGDGVAVADGLGDAAAGCSHTKFVAVVGGSVLAPAWAATLRAPTDIRTPTAATGRTYAKPIQLPVRRRLRFGTPTHIRYTLCYAYYFLRKCLTSP
jgi:hypothetical protein